MPDQKLEFQKIMKIGAEALGNKIAVEIIKELFGNKNDTEKLIAQAIEEICARVSMIVNKAFLDEYTSDANSIADKLYTYQQTEDVEILDELLSDASDTVHHLKRFDSAESIAIFNYACMLHLIVVQALAEKRPGYSEVLSRLGKQYAEWSSLKAQTLFQDADTSVNPPMSITRDNMEDPNIFSGCLIKEIRFNDKDNQLLFYTHYADKWGKKDLGNAFRKIESNPINIPKNSCYIDSSSAFRTIKLINVDVFIKDPKITKEIDNFNTMAQKISTEFRTVRVENSNAIKSSIYQVCEAWEKLDENNSVLRSH